MLSKSVLEFVEPLVNDYKDDALAESVIKGLQDSHGKFLNWVYREGLLWFKKWIYVPLSSPLIRQFLYEYHNTLIGGRSGLRATLKRLQNHFFWPNMKAIISKYVAKCDICQKSKSTNHAPYGLLQPIEPPTTLWKDLSMDFITNLFMSDQYTSILGVVDRFSKSARFIVLGPKYTAETMARSFWDSVGTIFGMPGSIISDRDHLFLSRFWTEFHYNTSYHTATGMTLFEAVFRRTPSSLIQHCIGMTSNEATDTLIQQRDEILRKSRENLTKSRIAMKLQEDRSRKDQSFQILNGNSYMWAQLKTRPMTNFSRAFLLAPSMSETTDSSCRPTLQTLQRSAKRTFWA